MLCLKRIQRCLQYAIYLWYFYLIPWMKLDVCVAQNFRIMQFYCRMNLKLDLSCSLPPDWPMSVLFVKLFIAIFQSATNILGEIIKLENSCLAPGLVWPPKMYSRHHNGPGQGRGQQWGWHLGGIIPGHSQTGHNEPSSYCTFHTCATWPALHHMHTSGNR